MVVDGAVDTERDALEPPEIAEDDKHADTEDDLFCAIREAAGCEDEVVEEMREHQDGEVECGQLYTRASSHAHE